MPNTSSTRTVADFVSDLQRHGLEWLARTHDCPVLMGGALDELSDSGFETVFADTGKIPARRGQLVELATRADVLSALVFSIRKRPGGPFANQIGIGRARNTDVWVPSPEISKYHAYVSRSPDGAYTITDAESANGTIVDRHTLAPLETRELLDGSIVQLGPHPFRFRLPRAFMEIVQEAARP
jgi:hypothetical protein